MPRLSLMALLALFAACLSPLAAQEWQTYNDPEYGYSVEYLPWAETIAEAETGYFEASWLTDKASSPNLFSIRLASYDPNSNEIDLAPKPGSPDKNLKDYLKVQGHTNVKILSSAADSLDGQPAWRIEYKSTLYGGLSMRSIQVQARWKDLLYTLSCTAEEFYYFDLAKPYFEHMIASFLLPREFPAYLTDYIRVRADLDGRDTVYHWKGKVFGVVNGEKRKELFGIEGYHILRAVRKEDGYYLLGREIAFFTDHRTGEVINTWRNPYTNKDVNVLHIFNDPMNQDCGFKEENWPLLPLIFPSQELGGDLAYYSEIFPYYPNPLSRRDFPLNSQSDTYQASEFTQYLASRADLANPDLTGVPAVLTFTRVWPWLPFMQMGERPGNAIMFCRGTKLAGGWMELPDWLRDYVMETRPEFISAPESYTQPNETPWTFFKKISVESVPPAGGELPER